LFQITQSSYNFTSFATFALMSELASCEFYDDLVRDNCAGSGAFTIVSNIVRSEILCHRGQFSRTRFHSRVTLCELVDRYRRFGLTISFLSTIRIFLAVPLHAMEALREGRYSSYSFTTSSLDGGEWSASCPGHALPPGKGPPGIHWTGGWVGPRAGLDTEARGKMLLPQPGIEPRSPGRPVRSQTLH
jgi:hypothetical protein